MTKLSCTKSPSRSTLSVHGKLKLSKNTLRIIEICIGEVIGTAMLMFFGCMSLVNGFSDSKVPSMQPGLMFGFVVCTVICIFGHISGAHLNPSVSVSAFLFKMISLFDLVIYVLSEILGALIGVGLLYVVTPNEILFSGVDGDRGFCTTVPHPTLTVFQAFLAEFLSTSILIFTCCGVWDKRNSRFGDSNGIKFALVVALCSITIGPYTGASMNPARSIAPAFYSGVWTDHWIYWTSPILSSVATTLLYKFLFSEDETMSEVSVVAPAIDDKESSGFHPVDVEASSHSIN